MTAASPTMIPAAGFESGQLRVGDLTMFATIGVDRKLLEEAGIRRVGDHEARELLSVNGGPGSMAGLFFPYFRSNDRVHRVSGRVRRDFPEVENGKPKNKYVAGYGDRRLLYYPPGAGELLANPAVPVILVESEKAALAITALTKRSGGQFVGLAMGGCYGWRGRIGKVEGPHGERLDEVGPLTDLDMCAGRRVFVVLDSNVQSNPKVRAARRELIKALKKKKSKAVIAIDLPGESQGVNGPDDFIGRNGDEAFLTLLETATNKSKSDAKGHLLTHAVSLLRESPEWTGVLAYDEFSCRTITVAPAPWQTTGGMQWGDFDDLKICEWLQNRGLSIGTRIASEAAEVISKENRIHPVREYLEGLHWDGQARINQWLTTYLGVPDTDYATTIGPRWLISGVARIMQPGCQVDHVLLLEGPQGIAKSSALRVLTGDAWFTDHISELGSKDSRLELLGKWILELGEFDRVRRGRLEEVKVFICTRVDNYRLPYGRHSGTVPRSCIFAATVNDQTPLTDETGNRRFWPVRCGTIDVNRLAQDRDQIWAETSSRYKAGEPWWLDTADLVQLATKEQEARYNVGAWDDVILEWCADPRQRSEMDGTVQMPVTPFDSELGVVTITDALLHALGKPLDRITQSDQNQVARCLVHNGWNRVQRRIKGRQKWFYANPTLCEQGEIES